MDILFARSIKEVFKVNIQEVDPLFLNLLVKELASGVLGHSEADGVGPGDDT